MSGISSAAFWWQYTTPSTLPSLQVWYNASDGTSFNKSSSPQANNTTVSSWQNAGVLTSRDWNAGGQTRPTYFTPVKNNLGAVRFSPAATTVLSINPIAYMRGLGGVTMAIVFKSSNTASGTRIVSTTDTNGFRWGQNGTQYIGGFAGATFTVNTEIVDTNWHHILIRFDGTQPDNATKLQARLDATPLTLTFSGTVGTLTSNTSSYFYGGADIDGSSNHFDGDIAELMFWTRPLSSSEINTVENYLTTKWNI